MKVAIVELVLLGWHVFELERLELYPTYMKILYRGSLQSLHSNASHC